MVAPSKDHRQRIIGYARPANAGQTIDAQVSLLRDAGCEEIYTEFSKGPKSKQTKLLILLKDLSPNDVVVVTRLNRMVSSISELFPVIRAIIEAGADLKSLGEPWIDTDTHSGLLVVMALGNFADLENDLCYNRKLERKHPMKIPNKRKGRPQVLTQEQISEIFFHRKNGETIAEISKSYNVSTSTIFKILRNETDTND